MTLSPSEYQPTPIPAWQTASQHWLTQGEQDELRSLLQRENPQIADADLGSLIKFGLLLLGAYLVFKALTSKS